MTSSLPLRKTWLDALRAMAIIFVVMGHQAQWWDVFFTFTTPVKIPLFFVISGYLFSTKEGKTKAFFINLFQKLVFPYFCLVTIPAICFAIFNGIGVLWKAWYSMLSGDVYWFMTCIIVAEAIHFFIRKYCSSLWLISVVCLLCATLGLMLSEHGFLNFARINNALICQVFLLLGFFIRKYEHVLDRVRTPCVILLLLLYFALCYSSQLLFSDISFDCHLNKYYSIPYCGMLIIIGCTTCFMLAKRINKFPQWLIFIGQNTLIIYLWAGYAMLLFVILGKIGVLLPEKSVLFAFVQTVWACLVCMGVAWMVNRYMPFIVGKCKRN